MDFSLLSTTDLRDTLIKHGIPEDDANALFDENVDGRSFLAITNDDLKDLGMKLGNRKKILAVINEAQPVCCEIVPSVEEVEVISPTMILSPSQNSSHNQVSPTINYMSEFKYTKPETIPVLDAVNACENGQKIVKNLRNGKIVKQSEVKEIVRAVLAMAVKDLKTMYPTSQQKINIAKAIVMAIPQLKNIRDGCKGFEHFYDPHLHVGMLEWRLKTMRLSLSPSKKKYSKRKTMCTEITVEEEEEDVEDMEDKISWLKYEVATETKKSEILATMKETFKVRRKIIQNKAPSITEVLQMYPKLKDFQGELIDLEFSLMYESIEGNFLGKFASYYAPHIIIYCKAKRLDIFDRYEEIVDENLKACLMLSDLLHTTGLQRKLFSEKGSKTRKFPSEYLMRFPGENVDFETLRTEKSSGPSQPSLVCQGLRQTRDLQFFLLLDHTIVEVGHCPIRAIDLLYKTHYIFNVKYNKACEAFYMFLDYIIYKMKKGPSRSSVENLNLLLNRISV